MHQKLKNVFLLAKKSFSSKKNLHNFLMAYVILRLESIRRLLIKFYQFRIGTTQTLSEHFCQKNFAEKLAHLNDRGFVMLDKTLPLEKIEAIKDYTAKLNCSDPNHSQVGFFKLADAPANVNLAGYQMTDLVKNNDIMALANDKDILSIVQGYFGCTPTITNVQMWWSLTGREAPQFAQLYHRDFDGVKFIKLFVYLTDVTEQDGPHLYVAGTLNSKKLRRPTRIPDAVIADTFAASDVTKMCGSKGMLFLEDTFGIHKGTLPILNNRLILQIQYGIQPLIDVQYAPVEYALPDTNAYVNRLYAI